MFQWGRQSEVTFWGYVVSIWQHYDGWWYIHIYIIYNFLALVWLPTWETCRDRSQQKALCPFVSLWQALSPVEMLALPVELPPLQKITILRSYSVSYLVIIMRTIPLVVKLINQLIENSSGTTLVIFQAIESSFQLLHCENLLLFSIWCRKQNIFALLVGRIFEDVTLSCGKSFSFLMFSD